MNTALIYAYALVGGLVLNVMPCVLPVLTMKVFHVVEQAKEDPGTNRRHGIAYSLGILAFFAGITAVVLTFKLAGEKLFWGQQFQSPLFVAGLATVMFVFGLNALGVFEFTVGLSHRGGSGYLGTFVNGLVAAVMATPCTAPGFSLFLPFALSGETPHYHTVGVFMTIGVGLALPFLAVSFVPAIARLLPKPGAWMSTFKTLMGFTLMGATVWLYGTLQSQLEPASATGFLAFLLTAAVGLWAYGKWSSFEYSDRVRWVARGVAGALVVAGGFFWIDLSPRTQTASAAPATAVKNGSEWTDPPVVDAENEKIIWTPYSEEVVKANLDRGRPVFMDFTAEWCANCKANEKAFIETATIRADLTRTNILPVKADFTNEDEEIEQMIEDLGRAGIPIYVVLTPDGKRHLLPEVINTELLSNALSAASTKFPPDQYAPPKPGKAAANVGPAGGKGDAEARADAGG
ncbi:MAG: thioredoxin family protein [Myxococcota bacterium]